MELENEKARSLKKMIRRLDEVEKVKGFNNSNKRNKRKSQM